MAQNLGKALGRLPATRQELEDTLHQIAKIREEILEKQRFSERIYDRASNLPISEFFNTLPMMHRLQNDFIRSQDRIRFLENQITSLTSQVRTLQRQINEMRGQDRTGN